MNLAWSLGTRWSWLSLLAAWLSMQCTFPEYDQLPADALSGGNAGDGPASTGGAAGNSAAAAGTGTAGEGGSAAAGGAPLADCREPSVQPFPEHCYDQERNDEETAVDCGGSCQGCSNEACELPTDCLSGTCTAQAEGNSCSPSLTLEFKADEINPSVSSLAWHMRIVNTDASKSFLLKGIKVRFYFARNGVVEPIVLLATKAMITIAGGGSELPRTVWTVHRTEPTESAVYDAYLEVSFRDSGSLFPGDDIVLYQQMRSGDNASRFDQRANYSFINQAEYSAWLNVAVFHDDELVWGREPATANPEACLAQAVNVNGPGVTVAGRAWQGASEAGVTTTGSAGTESPNFVPVASGDLANALTSFTRLEVGNLLELPLPNGTYLVYLYVVSPPTATDSGTLLVEGAQPDQSSSFLSQEVDMARAWGRLGPYRTQVTDQKLSVGVAAGAVHVAAIEVFQPE